MKAKTNSEIQEIFGLSRDDVRRLEKEEVIHPKKNGQGKVSLYHEDDLYRLLDIKMYLLSGYKISGMKEVLPEDYDSDEGITEQIHTYKKRIQMLEFIRDIKACIKSLEELNHRQLQEMRKASAEISQLPKYGSVEYEEITWEIVKLTFIVDFLCHKESLKADKKEIVLNRALSAYCIIDKVMKMSGFEIEDDIKDAILELARSPIESDQEIREGVKELVKEFSNVCNQFMDELDKQFVAPMAEKVDEKTGLVYQKIMNCLFNFVAEYFIDEQELFYLYKNFRRFIYELDMHSFEVGIIKLGEKNYE